MKFHVDKFNLLSRFWRAAAQWMVTSAEHGELRELHPKGSLCQLHPKGSFRRIVPVMQKSNEHLNVPPAAQN